MSAHYDALNRAADRLGTTWPAPVRAAVEVLREEVEQGRPDPDLLAVITVLGGPYDPRSSDLADAAVELAEELTARPTHGRARRQPTYGSPAAAYAHPPQTDRRPLRARNHGRPSPGWCAHATAAGPPNDARASDGQSDDRP